MSKLYKVPYKGYNYFDMYQWLLKNCQEPYYVGPGWTTPFVEFESKQDAVLFALRWS